MFSNINQYSMRRAVVYIKTPRWMFNQSCMNMLREFHSAVVFSFSYMWPMHKTILILNEGLDRINL